jgi:hypothetical protein
MKYWCFFIKFFQKLIGQIIIIFVGNDQYLLVLQILENSGRYWDTSIYQYMYQYCRYWKILIKYWNYQYCVRFIVTSIWPLTLRVNNWYFLSVFLFAFLDRLMIFGMWLYNDGTVSHVPSLSQFDLDLWPWDQIFGYKYHWPIWRDKKRYGPTDSKFANPFRLNKELTPLFVYFLV